MYLEKRNKFLKTIRNYTILNPELLQSLGFKYYFLIQNENMNNPEEVDILIRQSQIENVNFIILLESCEGEEIQNLLIYKLLTEFSDKKLLVFHYDEHTDRYTNVIVSISEKGKINVRNYAN